MAVQFRHTLAEIALYMHDEHSFAEQHNIFRVSRVLLHLQQLVFRTFGFTGIDMHPRGETSPNTVLKLVCWSE